MIIVSNATPLIALAKIQSLNLLRELFATILIPQAVYDEVVVHGLNRPGADEVRQASWIQTQAVSDTTRVNYLRVDLDPGEAEVLVLAEEINADWVLIDEPKGRLAAQLVGLKCIGTVGLLLLAKRQGKIPQVAPLLSELRAKGFYLGERVYLALLETAGE